MTTPMRISNELRVGIMFLTGLVLLVLVIVTLTRWGQDRNTYSFTMRFSQAQGILDGAAVRVAGVQVGRVYSVDFDSVTNEALVIARVNHKVRLYSNYHYTIGIGGLVGERYVEIRPVDHNRGGLLVDGSSVDGKTTPDMNDLFETTNSLLTRLSSTADSLNEIVASPENQRNLHDSLANFKQATANAADFTGGLNQLVQRDAPSVDTLIANLRGVSADARQVSESLAPQLVHTHIIRNLEEASGKALTIANRFEGIADSLNGIVNDKKISDDLLTTLRNFRKASEDLNTITAEVRIASASLPHMANNLVHASDDLPVITGNLARASNDVPVITHNLAHASDDIPEITSNLGEASDDLPGITGPIRQVAPETAQNLECISEKLLSASYNVDALSKKLANTSSSLSALQVKPLVRATALLGSPSTARTEADVDFIKNDGLFRAGIVGIYNRTYVNLQLGNKVSDQLWLRYGMIQSHTGVGVDYEITPNLIFTDELFAPNHLRMNALFDYRLGAEGPLWFNAGAYNLFQHPSLGLGITYRP